MSEKVDILGVKIDKITMKEAEENALRFLNEDKPHTIFTPNSEIIMLAYQNPEFMELLNSSDMLTADGIGVVHASKIVHDPLSERVAGFDLACHLLEKIAGEPYTVYFFGGKPGVAEQARDNLIEQYPSLKIIGTQDGYFDEAKEKEIISDIKAKKPDILFVCLGAPKQERWINEHKEELGARLLLGLGGVLDVWAGVAERAPEGFRKLGLEWFYRLLKQPSRIGRMMQLPKFGFTVLFKGKRVK